MKTPARLASFTLFVCLATNAHAQYTLKRSTSPLANYQPKDVTEVRTSTTSSVYKTYEDNQNKGSRTSVDLSQGFLYRNPASGKLEAVQSEGSTNRDLRNYTNDNGLPASQAANFTEVQTPGTNSRSKVYNTKDTGQTGVALDSQTGVMQKNAVTGKWEAVFREPGTVSSYGSSGSNGSGQSGNNGSSGGRQSLGDRIAAGVNSQLQQGFDKMTTMRQQAAQRPAATGGASSYSSGSAVSHVVPAPVYTPPVYNPTPTYNHSSVYEDNSHGHGFYH